MPDGRRVDLLLAVEVADTRHEVAEREDAADHQFGKPEGRRNILDAAAFLRQPDEILPLGHFVGVEPRHVLDHRRLDGVGVVAILKDGAGQRFGVTLFLRDDLGGGEAPRARDDLEGVGAAIGPDNQRHENATLAHGGKDVGDVRRLLGIAHIGLADGQLAKVDKVEFHAFHSFGSAGPWFLCGSGGPATQAANGRHVRDPIKVIL